MADFKKLLQTMTKHGDNTLQAMGLDIGGIAKDVRKTLTLKNMQRSMLPTPMLMALEKLQSKFGGKAKKAGGGARTSQNVQIEDDEDEEIEVLEAIAEYQEQSLEILKQIDENTRPDRLGDRERELEAKNKARLQGQYGEAANDANAAGKGLLGGIIGDLITGAVTGWLGGKGIKAAAAGIFKPKGAPKVPTTVKPSGTSRIGSIIKGMGGSVVSKAGSVVSAAGGVGKGVLDGLGKAASTGASAVSGTGKTILDSVKGVGSSVAKSAGGLMSSIKGTGASALKMLGTPLAVATSLYDVNQVATNDEMSDAAKNKEYTKIGTRLAGMWAGGKAGAAVGAGIGGGVGAGFAGVGAAPGAAVGGILGGIVGAIGGYRAGDSVGEYAGERVFNPSAVSADNVKVDSILPTASKDAARIKTNLILNNDLPSRVRSYVNGEGMSDYSDIKDEYYSYLKSQGLKFDDRTAMEAMSLAKKVKLEERAKIANIDASFKDVKHKDPTAVIKSVANSGALSATGVSDLDVGATRRTALSSLSNELNADHAESNKPPVVQPVVIQAPAQQSGSPVNNGSSNDRSRLEIPSSRNNDGTIQRLLNMSYKPLFG